MLTHMSLKSTLQKIHRAPDQILQLTKLEKKVMVSLNLADQIAQIILHR